MKEFKVMIHVNWPTAKKEWYKASGRNAGSQPVFTSKEDAEEWLKEMKQYHIKENHKDYLNATYKIMEREVTEWNDCPAKPQQA